MSYKKQQRIPWILICQSWCHFVFSQFQNLKFLFTSVHHSKIASIVLSKCFDFWKTFTMNDNDCWKLIMSEVFRIKRKVRRNANQEQKTAERNWRIYSSNVKKQTRKMRRLVWTNHIQWVVSVMSCMILWNQQRSSSR